MRHVSPVEAARSVQLASERLASALSDFGDDRLREVQKQAGRKLSLAAPSSALSALRRVWRPGRAQRRAERKLHLGAALSALPALPGSRGRAAQERAERTLHLGAGFLSAALAADTAAELFRGSSGNQAILAPLVGAPLSVAAGVLGAAAAAPRSLPRMPVRAALWLTAAIGATGVGLHIYGVSRDMGGWRNWSENAPLSAPPGFLGLALMGMAALALMDANDA
jgi:hypothetical protein